MLGVDHIGPYSPDVDGNIWGFVGVEVAHTQYGFVDLTADKEAITATSSLKRIRVELENKSSDSKTLKRVHHDCGGSFEGEFKQYLTDEVITNTYT